MRCAICITVCLLLGAVQRQAFGQEPKVDWQTTHVGARNDGGAVLPTDQAIHPVGHAIEFDARPTAIALRPGGRTAALLVTTGHFRPSRGPILIVDLQSKRLLQEACPSDQSDGSFTGLNYSPDGSRLFASDPNGSVMVADVAADGTLHGCRKIALPVTDPKRGGGTLLHTEGSNTGYPGGLALAPDGHSLYVALNMNNSLAVVDLDRNAVTGEIAVGNAPYAVVVDGDTAYVTNQGGRVAAGADYTNMSAGTEIVSDPHTGRPVSGTVSVVDLKTRRVVATIEVGLHPTAMTLSGGSLFVCNTNSDTVSVIDTATRRLIKTISVQPFAHAPFGSSPNAIAMLPNQQLVVSLGANNALAVYDWKGASETVRLAGLIPTAWYPSAILYDQAHQDLLVAALKGGFAPMEHVPDGQEYGRTQLHFTGSVSIVALPGRKTITRLTRTVIEDNRWEKRSLAEQPSRPGTAGKAIPDRLGEPSLIKHVIYIVKENHKYDEDLGDDPRGNGAPDNVEFGKSITPNQHAIVAQFPLLDNFYVSGTVSIDGHQWASSAFADDYIERGFGGQFKRGYPFNGGDNLAYAPTGFIWEDAVSHGKTVEMFGEYAYRFDGSGRNVSWLQWFEDSQTLEGKRPYPLHVKPGEFHARSDVPSVDVLLYRDFAGFDPAIPDQYRVDMFLREFNRHIANQDLPDLTIMTLPDDHGGGGGCPTIRSAVADNDLAFGRVVDAISHSPYWKDSVIFSVEDDASYGVDHVDGHRSPVYVVSPFARRGLVDHTYYTQIDVVRTIEQIFGLPPMNQRDLVATPLTTAFTDAADLTPFTALPNQVPLDEMNPPESASRLRQAWIKESAKLFTSRPDEGDENLTRRAIWYSRFDFTRPFPGDARVLYPSEVPRDSRKD
jgi:YVTN family beta-propeller protein